MSRDTTDGRAGGAAPPPPDDDIAALFDAQAQDLVVPTDLDARVRAAARAAAVDDGPDATPTPGAITERTRHDVLRHRRPPRWLAAAAVVGLAVALLPLLRQAPEPGNVPVADDAASPSPLDATIANDTTASDAATNVAEEVAESRVERAAGTGDASDLVPSEATAPTARRKATTTSALPPTPAPVLAPNGAGAGDDVPFDPIVGGIDAEHRRQVDTAEAEIHEEAEADTVLDIARGRTTTALTDRPREPRPVAIESARSPGVPRSSADASSFASTDTEPAADPFDGHRRTPTLWLERLRERLRADGLTPRLEAEYRRFRSRHPDVEPAFDPEAVAREGEAARR